MVNIGLGWPFLSIANMKIEIYINIENEYDIFAIAFEFAMKKTLCE